MSRGDISRCGHCPAKELVNEAAEGEGEGGREISRVIAITISSKCSHGCP